MRLLQKEKDVDHDMRAVLHACLAYACHRRGPKRGDGGGEGGNGIWRARSRSDKPPRGVIPILVFARVIASIHWGRTPGWDDSVRSISTAEISASSSQEVHHELPTLLHLCLDGPFCRDRVRRVPQDRDHLVQEGPRDCIDQREGST